MSLKYFDFIEIGSCDFDTLTQSATAHTGIVIEPVKEYLDNLPDKPNIIKINAAVSPDNTEGDADFFYIPSKYIKEHNLDDWLRGCNTLDSMHAQHKLFNLEEHVKVIKVKKYPLSKILEDYGVCGIGHLKIDIEGRDTELLENFLEYLSSKSKEYWPKKITFETNSLTSEDYVTTVIRLYTSIGYKTITRRENTILAL